MSLLGLFLIFFYVGSFTIGGGLVAITLMQQEILGRGLISPERFYNMVAISESTPGAIGINMATYIGYEMFGIGGSLITTLGTVLPSIIVIVLIAKYFGRVQDKPIVKAAFYGLRAGSTGMIAVAAWQVVLVALLTLSAFQKSGKWTDICNWPALLLFGGVFFIEHKFDLHPIFLILIGAVFGIIFL